MVISFTSVRKGQGQTVSAINFASYVSIKEDKKVLLIDTNRMVRDIEYYLNRSTLSVGLDEFINLHNNNMLNEDNFKGCVTETRFNLDIITSNEVQVLEEKHIRTLLDMAQQKYEFIVIDLSGWLANNFIKYSDVVYLVINQNIALSVLLEDSEIFEKYKSKIAFVVNRYAENINGTKIDLNKDKIKSMLEAIGYKNNQIYTLALEPELINACNQNSVLKFAYKKSGKLAAFKKSEHNYTKGLKLLLKHLYKKEINMSGGVANG